MLRIREALEVLKEEEEKGAEDADGGGAEVNVDHLHDAAIGMLQIVAAVLISRILEMLMMKWSSSGEDEKAATESWDAGKLPLLVKWAGDGAQVPCRGSRYVFKL